MIYALKFSKTGYIKYTSHLDMIRLFKRMFKRAGLNLKYSNGFNPHPRMSFAQPLSLGYSSLGELLEFELLDSPEPSSLMKLLSPSMPEGMELIEISTLVGDKPLGSKVYASDYRIEMPLNLADYYDAEEAVKENVGIILDEGINSLVSKYLNQDQILALKRQKKSKDLKEIDIKPMIRSIMADFIELKVAGEDCSGTCETCSSCSTCSSCGGHVYNKIILETTLDAGSESNCSPELVISSFLKFTGFNIDRSDIEVTRIELKYQ